MGMLRQQAILVTAPSVEPVTASEVKTYGRISESSEDSLIDTMIASAREVVEKYLMRALITQTWKLQIDVPYNSLYPWLPAGVYEVPVQSFYEDIPRVFDLPYKDIQSITSLQTYDVDNTVSTYDSSNYFLDDVNGRLILNEQSVFPANLRQRAAVVITYVCGYGDAASDVPASIKEAIKMMAVKQYETRGMGCEEGGMCNEAKRILRNYRIGGRL